MKFQNPFAQLTKLEWTLWITSVLAVTASSVAGGMIEPLPLAASLIGVTALIFVARGDVLGQILTVAFSVMYGMISWECRYYGEMITYVGMTAPIAVMSAVSWIRHPYKKGKNEVEVAKLSKKQAVYMFALAIAVTSAFYFILKYFNTANLFVSTVSITTSFIASYLMLCRSSAYALAYAANDLVLIALWTYQTIANLSNLPMTVCFVMFLLNDIYGYVNWKRMGKRQNCSGIQPV